MHALRKPHRAIVLATGSRYRCQLFANLGLAFESSAPGIDESAKPGESSSDLALRLALGKAQALANRYPDHLIIGSDQVAELDGVLLGKPGTRANAIAQLQMASGRTLVFHTGVCVLDSRMGISKCDLDRTRVRFRQLSEQQISNYVDLEQPFDCAGSFKSEALGIALFEKIEGTDPNALIGLPLIRLIGLLEEFGCAVL